MGRRLETEGLKQLLFERIEHPAWDEVAKRCMACANCTMVCPTCFCSTVTDSNDLATGTLSRTRRWESCFTQQFSYTTAGAVRGSIRARYRHWMRHKLGTWWDQFGSSGCVGCGRCITWCPVGIDITEQVQRLKSNEATAYYHEASRRGRTVMS
jgi:ferredoxin